MTLAYTRITDALKRTLKQREITYAELADAIGLSESGVKKLMNAADGSVGRLAQICHVIGVPLSTLVEAAEDAPPEPIPWTSPKAVRFFEAHPAHWYFLWELQERDFDADAVARTYDLDPDSVLGYARDLEAIGYVRVTRDGRILNAFPGHSGWRMLTGLAEHVLWPLQAGLLEHIRRRVRTPERAHPDLDLLAMQRLTLRPEVARELHHALLELIREFGRRAERETELQPPETPRVELGVMTLLAPFSLADVVDIPRMSGAAEG